MPDSRRPWTQKEDDAIKTLVKKYGIKRWADVSSQLQTKYKVYGRTGKQCRQRWHNHLNPEINKNPWSAEQQQKIFQAHRKYGNQWTQISKLLQGRTDNSIKNYFYSTLRKALRRVNKILGSKNSTTVMRTIKPSILSQIFYYSGLEQDEITQKNRSLVEDCKELSQLLVQFSTNSNGLINSSNDLQKASNQNTVSHFNNKQEKQKLQYLIQRLIKFNQQYQNISKQQKKRKLSRGKSKSYKSSIQKQLSQQQQKQLSQMQQQMKEEQYQQQQQISANQNENCSQQKINKKQKMQIQYKVQNQELSSEDLKNKTKNKNKNIKKASKIQQGSLKNKYENNKRNTRSQKIKQKQKQRQKQNKNKKNIAIINATIDPINNNNKSLLHNNINNQVIIKTNVKPPLKEQNNSYLRNRHNNLFQSLASSQNNSNNVNVTDNSSQLKKMDSNTFMSLPYQNQLNKKNSKASNSNCQKSKQKNLDNSFHLLDIPQDLQRQISVGHPKNSPRLKSKSSKLSKSNQNSSGNDLKLNKKESQLSDVIHINNGKNGKFDFNIDFQPQNEDGPILDGLGINFGNYQSPKVQYFLRKTPRYPTPGQFGGNFGIFSNYPQPNLKKNNSGSGNSKISNYSNNGTVKSQKKAAQMDRLLEGIKSEIKNNQIKRK